jgi:hypothetical protein
VGPSSCLVLSCFFLEGAFALSLAALALSLSCFIHARCWANAPRTTRARGGGVKQARSSLLIAVLLPAIITGEYQQEENQGSAKESS